MGNGTRLTTTAPLDDSIDLLLRKAAWKKEKRKPNGELEGASFHWPKTVKEQYDLLDRIFWVLRRYECGCSEEGRHAEVCEETRRLAYVIARGYRFKRHSARKAALMFAKRAHVPRPEFTREEDGD